MSAPLTAVEQEMIAAAARRAGRRWRTPVEDIEQGLWVWALENLRTVAKYRDEVNGLAKLGTALRRTANRQAGQDAAPPGPEPEPGEPASASQVKALLSVVWAPDEWPKPAFVCHPRTGAAIRGPDQDEVEIAWAMLHDLAVELDRQAPETRRLLWLRYRQGMHTAEVAEILGISADAVDVRAHRAVERLAAVLGPLNPPRGSGR